MCSIEGYHIAYMIIAYKSYSKTEIYKYLFVNMYKSIIRFMNMITIALNLWNKLFNHAKLIPSHISQKVCIYKTLESV